MLIEHHLADMFLLLSRADIPERKTDYIKKMSPDLSCTHSPFTSLVKRHAE